MMDERSTSLEIRDRHPEIAVLGTDWMIAGELSRRVASELNAFLLPTIPISMSECHGSIESTVWIKPATLSAVLQDIASSLNEQGIFKLLVLNAHGGNFILAPTIQELNFKYPNMLIIMAPEEWPTVEGGLHIFEKPETDLHAGEIETSIQLYLNPRLVKPERMDYVPPVGREFLDYMTMDVINPEGVWGSPSKGNAEKGARALAAQVKSITFFARQSFARKS